MKSHSVTNKSNDNITDIDILLCAVVDASARSVAGGLWGNRFQLGSFDGCLSVGDVSPVGARYCLATLTATATPCRPQQDHWDHVAQLNPYSDVRDAMQVSLHS